MGGMGGGMHHMGMGMRHGLGGHGRMNRIGMVGMMGQRRMPAPKIEIKTTHFEPETDSSEIKKKQMKRKQEKKKIEKKIKKKVNKKLKKEVKKAVKKKKRRRLAGVDDEEFVVRKCVHGEDNWICLERHPHASTISADYIALVDGGDLSSLGQVFASTKHSETVQWSIRNDVTGKQCM